MAYVVDESNTNPPWSISGGPAAFFCAPGAPLASMARNATGLASGRSGDLSERPNPTSRASRSTADCDLRSRTKIVVTRSIDTENLRAMDGGLHQRRFSYH